MGTIKKSRNSKLRGQKLCNTASLASNLISSFYAPADKRMNTIPWGEWEKFVKGQAQTSDWFDITLCLRVGNQIVSEHYAESSLEQLNECVLVCLHIDERHSHTGKWGATPEEIELLRVGLAACSEISIQTERAIKSAAFAKVLRQINETH